MKLIWNLLETLWNCLKNSLKTPFKFHLETFELPLNLLKGCLRAPLNLPWNTHKTSLKNSWNNFKTSLKHPLNFLLKLPWSTLKAFLERHTLVPICWEWLKVLIARKVQHDKIEQIYQNPPLNEQIKLPFLRHQNLACITMQNSIS